MLLQELIEQVPSFEALAPKDCIKLFGWWLHSHRQKDLFTTADIRGCYKEAHLLEPPALATYLSRMSDAKDLLRDRDKYKLARTARTELDKKYGVHQSVLAINKILTELPTQIPDVSERAFLNEALSCYRVRAFRSCIVMVWNLAYSHLLDWILKEPVRLAAFNGGISKRNSKKAALIVTKFDDFEELKEREVIDICSSAGLFNSSVYKVMRDKLDRRNMAAHPSEVIIVQSQADDVVTDLVHNVMLSLR